MDRLARISSAVDIEVTPLKVFRQVVDRGPGVEGSGVERFVAQQAGQLHELPRVLSQVMQREGMPERVGRDPNAGDLGPTSQLRDQVLNGAYVHGAAAPAQEEGGFRRKSAARFQIGAKCPARRGIQGHLSLFASLALPD